MVLHSRSKHINEKFHFLRDLTKDGMIEIIYYKGEEQVYDIFIKSLKLKYLVKLKDYLMYVLKKTLYRRESHIAKLMFLRKELMYIN